MQKQMFIIVEWFICRNCGWLHLGYPSQLLEMGKNLIYLVKRTNKKKIDDPNYLVSLASLVVFLFAAVSVSLPK